VAYVTGQERYLRFFFNTVDVAVVVDVDVRVIVNVIVIGLFFRPPTVRSWAFDFLYFGSISTSSCLFGSFAGIKRASAICG
jgi:hypothetical protein